jgi:hypothetical protein
MCKVSLSDSLPVSAKEKKRLAMQEKAAEQFRIRNWVQLEEYKSVREKMSFICEKGHRHKIAWETLGRGAGLNGCYFVSQEVVEEAFAKINWVLRSKYTHSMTPLDYTCHRGHEGSIKWHDFVGGSRCQDCYKEDCRLSQEYVTQQFVEKRGWTVTGKYINSGVPIEFICDQGHSHQICWDAFVAGTGCGACKPRRVLEQKSVEKEFAKENWIVSSEYTTSDKNLQVICDKGHHIEITFHAFSKGTRCGVCYLERHKPKQEDINKVADLKGLKLLSPYVDAQTKMKFTCSKGHQGEILWNKLSMGRGCGECYKESLVTDEDVLTNIRARNWKLRSPFVPGEKIKFTCENGHNHSITWANLKNNVGCGRCRSTGYNPARSGILYYIRFDLPGLSLWKIGITNKSVKIRFAGEQTPYSILWQERYEDGSIPPKRESAILNRYKKTPIQRKIFT